MPTPEQYLELYEKGLVSKEQVLQSFGINEDDVSAASDEAMETAMSMASPFPDYAFQVEMTTLQAEPEYPIRDIIEDMFLETALSFARL